jgi:hypothetical protein
VPYGRTPSELNTVELTPYDDLGLLAIERLSTYVKVIQRQGNVVGDLEEECLGAIYKLKLGYELICGIANQVINYLQEGKNPKNIRWEEVHRVRNIQGPPRKWHSHI